MTKAPDRQSGERPWCLVMALWGDKYGAAHVNELAGEARRQAPGLTKIVLLTDRHRPDVAPMVSQAAFPDYFQRPEFFQDGYRIKLSIFSRLVLPADMPCLFVDLDTIVLGDLGRIAALVSGPTDCFMMPPTGLGFGRLRRITDRIRPGMNYPTGNSSLVAFHSGAEPNLAETFQRMHAAGTDVDARYMLIDDRFISWFARDNLRAIPNDLAVMFRREFLSRSLTWLWLRGRLPAVRRRREGLVAITLNGAAFSADSMADMAEGTLIREAKGRKGYWSESWIGPSWQKIIASCRRVVAARQTAGAASPEVAPESRR
ncbi:MAG: hypothetical protein HC844_10515 [Tabrizicola sp.]|nr:hypothetical protein [Tabrizicola sp.]